MQVVYIFELLAEIVVNTAVPRFALRVIILRCRCFHKCSRIRECEESFSVKNVHAELCRKAFFRAYGYLLPNRSCFCLLSLFTVVTLYNGISSLSTAFVSKLYIFISIILCTITCYLKCLSTLCYYFAFIFNSTQFAALL